METLHFFHFGLSQELIHTQALPTNIPHRKSHAYMHFTILKHTQIAQNHMTQFIHNFQYFHIHTCIGKNTHMKEQTPHKSYTQPQVLQKEIFSGITDPMKHSGYLVTSSTIGS